MLATYARDSVLLKSSSEQRFSMLGGLPDFPEKFARPNWNGSPLAFICQLKLSELPAYRQPDFPERGFLYVFYDQDQATWGFDPKDQGSWKLVYVADEAAALTRATAPKGLEIVYKELAVGFGEAKTYPTWDDPRVNALGMDDKQMDAYFDYLESPFVGLPKHQLFGYPSAVQNGDMEPDCQLAANGLYCGDASGYEDPRAARLAKDKGDWVLLLQIDSDDRTEMMWGDTGMLYFWIRKRDLAKRDFDKTWMLLQCY